MPVPTPIDPDAETAARLTRRMLGTGLQQALRRVLEEPIPPRWLALLRDADAPDGDDDKTV